MKAITCIRCDRDVAVPEGMDPRLVFHVCHPRSRRPARPIVMGRKTMEESRSEMFAAFFEAVDEEQTTRRL